MISVQLLRLAGLSFIHCRNSDRERAAERAVMLQNVEIPKRFGDSNTDIMAAKSLPIRAPRGGTEHQIQLAEIHLGEAALQYQSRPTTSLSTAYRH